MIGQKDWIIIGLAILNFILIITTIHFATRKREKRIVKQSKDEGKSMISVDPHSINLPDQTRQTIPADVTTIKIVRRRMKEEGSARDGGGPRPLYF